MSAPPQSSPPSSNNISPERLHQIAGRKLAALGIVVRPSNDRRFLEGEYFFKTAQVHYPGTESSIPRARFVVRGHDHPLLLKTSLHAEDASWVSGQPPRTPSRHGAKTRYRQLDAECTLSAANGKIEVEFPAPQWAVTPGQSVVLYDGEVCLGGGVIT